MTPRITNEMRQALVASAGQPLSVEDEQTRQVYVLVDRHLHQEAMEALEQQRDVAAVQAGLDAASKGRFSTLEEVDARIREKLGFSRQ